MSSQDVRSILNLPQTGSSSVIAKRSVSTLKKPDGISRELYALIGDNAPSLAEAQAAWTPFTPTARSDNPARLGHWARVTDADPNASGKFQPVYNVADRLVEYFGKFNLHGPSLMEYSQFEFDQHLADSDWTSHETAYLFDLLKTYDLRFIIAADRYSYRGITGTANEKRRSVEAQQQLIHAYGFDKSREIKRKQYASELFHLTAAEIAEEEALYIEIKRMEQNERRYRADRDDLMRTVMGLDSGLVEFDQSNVEAIFGVDKSAKEQAAFDLQHCIYNIPPPPTNPHSSHLASKHPVHQQVHMRSLKIPLPKPNASIRITELLNELGISAHKLVMPTRANIEMFDNLLQAAGALIDMKRQVDRVEQELRTVKAQKEGLLPTVDTRKARSESVTSTDTAMTTNNRRSRPL
ncbi:uncharacterized protein L201_007364 [Kwoniella dendrophila CBS 6074]|uniref:SWR1-complex protein 4 n=1 Tax=Kwoniella dendrophila CBS 6074 TaxID=1295534 RepID=A0AAX4K4C0_9TREE